MTHVSRKKLEVQVDKFLNKLLTAVLTKKYSAKEASKIMKVLITPTEINMMRKRIGIIYLLNKGMDLENISKLTKTTRQTVARIRLQLLEVESEDKQYLINILKKIQFTRGIKDLFNAILSIDISRSTMKKKISPF
ncbi:MAG: hypothetical protein US53_C0014G0009 [Candidatus Woesebacteria bacterium GW2011_GWA1_37_7]|uniref:TrpR like protein, YerC/YecD n=1 Tax=Candidatus Woesebacteria bacterium GW2011_GWA1_37_7 TaxID=1618545 RepID=A0A0G0JLN7_9BACT|nr:MAG: hypothetical protein US53_C0014G0009 [Candidatus Woesebacteria bacterium GW2011_GWA1_37_7]